MGSNRFQGLRLSGDGTSGGTRESPVLRLGTSAWLARRRTVGSSFQSIPVTSMFLMESGVISIIKPVTMTMIKFL